MAKLLRAASLIGWFLFSLPLWAQHRSVMDDFDTQAVNRGQVASLGSDLFGDKIEPNTRAVTILVTDVSLAGNNDLPVAMQRKFQSADDGLGWMRWSDFELPHISGLYRSGTVSQWQGDNLQHPEWRCSQGQAPEVDNTDGKPDRFFPEEYWHGIYLNLPESNSEVMQGVINSPGQPQDGASYFWATQSRWFFSCLPSAKNGVSGEGFLARSPDGKRYYFDWFVNNGLTSGISKPAFGGSTTGLTRNELRAYPTRVEDRFGNWVAYSYSGKNLTKIEASDGRKLVLSYDAVSGKLSSLTDGSRTWLYSYVDGIAVTHPDGTQWKAKVLDGITRRTQNCSGSSWNARYIGEATLQVQHPSGAMAQYRFLPARRGVSFIPFNSSYDYCGQLYRDVVESISITSKTVSGPALAGSVWSFSYGPAVGCYTGSAPAAKLCTQSSSVVRTVDVTGPGDFVRYTYGSRLHDTDGSLLKVQRGLSSSIILESEDLVWESFGPVGYPFAMAGDQYFNFGEKAIKEVKISRDGVIYNKVVNNFDSFARPLSVTRSSNISYGYSRTEDTSYHDNLSKWVLSQVATVSSNGSLIDKTEYDSSAMAYRSYRFGDVTPTRTLTYNTDGTIATVKDANNNVTSLSNWKRGIPQSIHYPATPESPSGSTQAAQVNDNGWIDWVIDENGYKTSYGYDAMGRVSSVAYPTGDSVGWNTLSRSFEQVNQDEFGIPAGHWRQVSTQGNYQKVTVFDALWRPLWEYQRDLSNNDATFSLVGKSYDPAGRLAFVSCPRNPYADGNWAIDTGTRTTYDALDRVIKVEQNSELGMLTTTTQYLNGGEPW